MTNMSGKLISLWNTVTGFLAYLLKGSTPLEGVPSNQPSNVKGSDMDKDQFVKACFQFLNIPYIWGGDDPIIGYDCSGLAQELYAMLGIDPKGDQTAQALYNAFASKSNRVGDVGSLVFYGKSKTSITHVGVMISPTAMIEAGGGGSKTNTNSDAAKQNAYIRIRPINRRTDVVAVLQPLALPWV